MRRFDSGDQVRIDIPDVNDPDFDRYHGRNGEVIDVIEDDAGRETGDERDSYLFVIEFDDQSTAEFRWRDLRPVSDGTQ